eukprot:370188_1
MGNEQSVTIIDGVRATNCSGQIKSDFALTKCGKCGQSMDPKSGGWINNDESKLIINPTQNLIFEGKVDHFCDECIAKIQTTNIKITDNMEIKGTSISEWDQWQTFCRKQTEKQMERQNDPKREVKTQKVLNWLKGMKMGEYYQVPFVEMEWDDMQWIKNEITFEHLDIHIDNKDHAQIIWNNIKTLRRFK